MLSVLSFFKNHASAKAGNGAFCWHKGGQRENSPNTLQEKHGWPHTKNNQIKLTN